MFRWLRHLSPKTKILFLGSLLILLPSGILSYLGLQSVEQKIDSLRTHHRSTAGLIRDKAEREILRAEEDARAFVLESLPRFEGPKDFQEWLRRLQSTNPFLEHPFVVRADGGLLSSMISRGWVKPKPVVSLRSSAAALHCRSAEAAEFGTRDLSEALRFYRGALQSTPFAQDRALIYARIGRCNLKLGRYRESIAEYINILSLKHDLLRIGCLPAPVVALSQIADAYQALGESVNYRASVARLNEYLLRSPWDVESGEYSFYLTMSRGGQRDPSEKAPEDVELKRLEEVILDQMHVLNLFAEDALPQIRSALQSGTRAELRRQHFFVQSNHMPEQYGFLGMPEPLQEKGILGVGYRFRPEFLSTELLPRLLSPADLEPGVIVAVLNERDSVLYIQDGLQPSNRLATESFREVFPSWKVVLFDRQGRSIEELVGSERRLYLVLVWGVVFVMAVGILLTVRAAAHEAEVSRLKTEFVSNVSHELKTPLTLIRMFGETLESGLVTDEAQRKEFSGIIRKESERLTHLINTVLDFSKMDAGNKEYHLDETDLVEVVRGTLEAYAFHIRDLGFAIESHFPREPIRAQIDRDAISQAILNMLSNATKYSDAEKHIGIRVVQKGPVATISVEDRGVGIPRESLGKIFDKFYRVPNDKTRATRGTGLGLSLTKHIVEAHHGTIEVESTVGKGSIFTIAIPIQIGAQA